MSHHASDVPQKEASFAAGIVIVLAVTAINLSSNLLANSLITGGVSVAPIFLVWFNVSFDVCGFAIARCLERSSKTEAASHLDESLADENSHSANEQEPPIESIGDDYAAYESTMNEGTNGIEDQDLLLPQAKNGKENTAQKFSATRLRFVAFFLCLLYQSGNCLYFMGLAATPLGVSQVVYQSATAFVFLFSIMFLRGFVANPLKVLSLLMCIVGVSLVSTAESSKDSIIGKNSSSLMNLSPSVSDSTGTGEPSSDTMFFGILCLLASSSLWALYEVMLPLLLPDASPPDLNRFIAWRGIWNFFLLWPLPLYQAFVSPSEYVFTQPDIFFAFSNFGRLLAMALLSVGLSILIAVGITITSPLYMRIGSTLNAPVSVLYDTILLGRGQNFQSISGLLLTVVSFVLVALPCTEKTTSPGSKWHCVSSGPCWSARCRRVFNS